MPPIIEPTEIPAFAPDFKPLLLPEGEEVACGFDDVGVVVAAAEVGFAGEGVGEADIW